MLIHSYSPRWEEDFLKIKKVLSEALKSEKVDIAHIGSTSVPGLAAKPIIDIDIIYREYRDFERIKNGLSIMGYFHNGDQGIPQREAFLRNKLGVKHSILDHVTHHLYVCHQDSEELRRHLLFRDYLIKNEQARLDYGKIKIQLAERTNQNRKEYAALKEIEARDFILGCIEKAEFTIH